MLCRSHGRGLTPLDSAHRAGKGRPTDPAIFFDLLKTDISSPHHQKAFSKNAIADSLLLWERSRPQQDTMNCEQKKEAVKRIHCQWIKEVKYEESLSLFVHLYYNTHHTPLYSAFYIVLITHTTKRMIITIAHHGI